MYKNLLKKIIAFLLVCSFVMPSYCALQNDGAMFITKAEFDAALSDFNSRLTTFEASINSKIDSQVAAYLERNGIWRSKDQICNYSTTEYSIDLRSKGFSATGVNIGNFTLIDNVNKSGLCLLIVTCTGCGIYDNVGSADGTWLGVYSLVEQFSNSNKGDAMYASMKISDYSVRGSQGCSGQQPCMAVASGKRPYMFFVKSGDKVKCSYVQYAMLFSNTTPSKMSSAAGNSGTMKCTYSAKVY